MHLVTKTPTRSESELVPAASVSCWPPVAHLSASRTACSRTWTSSAPSAGTSGTCRGLSRRSRTCHLDTTDKEEEEEDMKKKKTSETPNGTGGAVAAHLRSPCSSRRCRNQEAPTAHQADLHGVGEKAALSLSQRAVYTQRRRRNGWVYFSQVRMLYLPLNFSDVSSSTVHWNPV
jgi:hypothetical protein